MKQVEQLQREGKIKGFRQLDISKTETGARVASHMRKRSKEKDWISWNLSYWCNEKSVMLEEEFRFSEERKFRFDWCIPVLRIAIEYNGLFSEKSRHTTPAGYTRDMDKLNLAQALGWRVIQLTPLNYKKLIQELNKSIT